MFEWFRTIFTLGAPDRMKNSSGYFVKKWTDEKFLGDKNMPTSTVQILKYV